MLNTIIGEHSYVERGFRILWNKPDTLGNNINPKLVIGKYCSIAENLTVYLGGNHPMNYMTTSSLHFRLLKDSNVSWREHLSSGDVVIGNDVWIGDNVVIMSGSTINDGAVIGAYSVVRSTILPYSINFGNPARYIRKRFSYDIETKLIEMQWWDWNIDKIKESVHLLESEDINGLYDYYLKNIKV